MIMYRKKERDADEAPALFQPGDLVRHRRYGYRGVVVDLDHRCRASDEWYQSNQTQPSRSQPWYHVLVHRSPQTTYAAESNLEADGSGAEVVHPLLELYFRGLADGKYLRNDRPWGI